MSDINEELFEVVCHERDSLSEDVARLRAINAGDAKVIATYRVELDRHIALNAELLAALERISDLASSDDWSSTILSIANAAIARAKAKAKETT